jgi:nucleoside-triphosphatase
MVSCPCFWVDYDKKFMGILDFWSIRGAKGLLKRVLLLTGSPGVGKTTVLLKTVNALKDKGYRVGGMISREVREGGTRVGFEILDLGSSKRGWLAHVNQKSGPQVGRYRVNIADLNAIGAQAILDAVENCDVIAIDEIGPMELFSEKFKEAALKALDSGKPVVAIIHWKARNKLLNEAKLREDAEISTITLQNREKLHEQITEQVTSYLNCKKGYSQEAA